MPQIQFVGIFEDTGKPTVPRLLPEEFPIGLPYPSLLTRHKITAHVSKHEDAMSATFVARAFRKSKSCADPWRSPSVRILVLRFSLECAAARRRAAVRHLGRSIFWKGEKWAPGAIFHGVRGKLPEPPRATRDQLEPRFCYKSFFPPLPPSLSLVWLNPIYAKSTWRSFVEKTPKMNSPYNVPT